MSAQAQILLHLGALLRECLRGTPKVTWHVQGIGRALRISR
jgi:hypothetical protein